MIRVLVVDDSPTARALLVEILRSDPEIQVVGEAKDGIEGVELTGKLRPSLVTMDVRMPRLDGFAATKEIMIASPTPIVIVTSSFDAREVEIAMQSLRAGALAVLRKPPGPDSPAFEETARKLVGTVKAMAQVKVVRHWRPQGGGPAGEPRAPQPAPPTPRPAPRASLVAIATSTGGPAALHRLLSRLPGDFPSPVLVVQHNAPGFMGGLVRWLDGSCDLTVKVAEQGERLRAHTVYLAPDERHLGVSAHGTALLSGAPPVGGFRPSGTYLFESAARACGSSVVALILTGMGEDGVEGLRAVRQAGGQVIAQDEDSSVVWGMPGAAVAAGLADSVLPLDTIPIRLMELVINH
ncbi:MAG TPA: chemotaxis-specific protein-glutamate methyltransferase CheB [Gemmataceae bacterium]|nr:chemotaxis-specific protein-glutamate methyltransferase CheB [Gemmataceae bacterium]